MADDQADFWQSPKDFLALVIVPATDAPGGMIGLLEALIITPATATPPGCRVDQR